MKDLKFEMFDYVVEMAEKPLRTKKDIIQLLLRTLSMMLARISPGMKQEVIYVHIDKMNRIFYSLQSKIFSVQFPFSIDIMDDENIRIYDVETGLDIDFTMVSALTSVLCGEYEEIEDMFCVIDDEASEKNISAKDLWHIVRRLLAYEVGYLRYDFDEEHVNGKLHPLNHLDINYEDQSTYKLGLENKIDYAILKNLVDTKTDCNFLDI